MSLKKSLENHKSLESAYESASFVQVYNSCLLDLTKRERDVMKLWFDKYMMRLYNEEEIGKILNIKPRTVLGIKNRALKKIRENPKMQRYKK